MASDQHQPQRFLPLQTADPAMPAVPIDGSLQGEPQSKSFVPAAHNLWFLPIPVNKRYHPDRNFKFGLALNLLFGFAATFTVANLYYNQPLLFILANEWGVQYDEISRVPTLLQCGYAVGILLLAPLGDMVRRRGLVLLLIALTATLSIGLALAPNLITFEVLGFFVAVLTVTPQIMVPLTADLAPPESRSKAISITLSGLMLGVLVARVLSGIIAEFADWRYVYWMSVGLQYLIFIMLWWTLPDYPAKVANVGYWQVLWSMATYLFKYPTMVQCCLIGFFSSAVFTNWWTTLTFLLSDPPYEYNTLEIGLFGLLGLFGVCVAPFTGKLLDQMEGWLGQLAALIIQISAQAIAVGAAKRNVSAVVIVCFVLDVGLQMGQVSNSTRIYALDANARARLNSIFIISLFLGQMMGSSAASSLYDHYGWTASSSLSLGFLGLAILILLSRGPHAQKWIGWDGGARMRKLRREEEERAAEDTAGIESEKTGGEESDVEKASGSASGILHELAKSEKASGCFSTLTPPQDGRSG
ncbi:hypothetical protein NliqN6_4102 [Naganishia liquefaciens]|uniref:Major facilitator superfamily (MFS) profile domain-containing protein n=1 Tax=Naganishia liquefaciens TaxID=104408 RepID=A0A8H3YFG1_9TREE|nr:hypothetical protein NliqN6_4102 [Naganishia liquefaciens]